MNLDQTELQVILAEMKARFDRVEDKIDLVQSGLAKVESQANLTNGRLKTVELFNAGVQGGKIALVGVGSGIGAIAAIVATALSGGWWQK